MDKDCKFNYSPPLKIGQEIKCKTSEVKAKTCGVGDNASKCIY